jgi:peptidoglycan/LPS O-acetylase OafA/YrhL
MTHDSSRLKKNNFDLLRIVLASIVCLVHSYQLSGFSELRWFRLYFSGEIAVRSFFIVSGFLIFMSYDRSSSLTSYFTKRIRRIYPAYFTIVVLCAIGLVTVSTLSAQQYYFSADWFKYLAANLSFLNFVHPTLPGVFASNEEPFVNPALWTLKIEMMFYFSVPIIAYLMKKFSPGPVIALIYALSLVYFGTFKALAQTTGNDFYEEIGRQLPGQLSYFMSGAFFYYFLPTFEKYATQFLAAACAVLVLNKFFSLAYLVPFALATVVVFSALYFYMGRVGKYGDFSYGLYIIHAPTIQILMTLNLFPEQPWLFLATTVLLTAIGAILMWHLVEKRFLLRNSHYVAETQAETKKVDEAQKDSTPNAA